PQLRTLPGVSEINAWGGQTKQYQIVAGPALLDQDGVTLHGVETAAQQNKTNFGGGYIEHAAEQYTLLGTGRAVTTQDLGSIVLAAKNGTAVLLRDVADVRIGSEARAMWPTCASAPRRRREPLCGTAKPYREW